MNLFPWRRRRVASALAADAGPARRAESDDRLEREMLPDEYLGDWSAEHALKELLELRRSVDGA